MKFSVQHQQLIKTEAVTSLPDIDTNDTASDIVTKYKYEDQLTSAKVTVSIKFEVTNISLKIVREVQAVFLFH